MLSSKSPEYIEFTSETRNYKHYRYYEWVPCWWFPLFGEWKEVWYIYQKRDSNVALVDRLGNGDLVSIYQSWTKYEYKFETTEIDPKPNERIPREKASRVLSTGFR